MCAFFSTLTTRCRQHEQQARPLLQSWLAPHGLAVACQLHLLDDSPNVLVVSLVLVLLMGLQHKLRGLSKGGPRPMWIIGLRLHVGMLIRCMTS